MTFGTAFVIAMSIPCLFHMTGHALALASCYRAIPREVSDIYSTQVYQKWLSFKKESSLYYLICSIFGIAVYLLLAGTDMVYPLLENLQPTQTTLMVLSVIVCLMVVFLQMPFRYYDQMVLKKKYGFCRKSIREFWKEQVFYLAFAAAAGMLLAFLIYICFLEKTEKGAIVLSGNDSFLPLGAGVVLLTAFVKGMPYIAREFGDRKRDMHEGSLKEKLALLSAQMGFQGKIKVTESFEKKRLNAYYTPIGNQVVLYQSMLEVLTEDEICGAVAHEVAHEKHADFWVDLLCDLLLALIACYAYWNQLNYCFSHAILDFGTMIPGKDGIFLIIIMLLYIPFSRLLKCCQKRISIYRADAAAAENGFGEGLISALKRAAQKDFEDLNPHPLYVLLYDSYPPLYQRIQHIRSREAYIGKHEPGKA